ncbi:probable G-protein coupled receptor 34 [Triplophysa rosa]|uniref:probable G-protein coupled receptor 34 n=1 Tax=Triplophysa rosa TaxID=992332 RepID=UPI002545FB11|nr:probable G-protein coupled receptor 34 [Triplophysa rosa]XP_057191952.1 probable G-protein coupled receptor 34 [Triplophysa rosa]
MENNATLMFPNTSKILRQDRKCQMDNTNLQVPLAIFYALFFLFGLVGNLLALWVFLRVHSKKNSIRIFLINLALADLLLVICLPFRVAYHSNNDRWVLPPVMCRIVGNVFYTNMYISITLLGLISVDRYLKFQMASCRRMFLQSRWSVLLCCIIWTLAFAALVPLIIQAAENNESQKCFQYKKLNNSKWIAYFNFVIVALFWVVYAGLVISYGKIGMKLFTTSREKPDFPNATKYNKTAWKSFFVLFLFTLCFVPYHSVRIFYITSQMTPDTSCDWVKLMDKTNEIVLLLSALNSCLDPVMYFLLCGSIRKVMLKIVCRGCCLQNTGFFNTSNAPQEQVNAAVPMTAAQEHKLAKTCHYCD